MSFLEAFLLTVLGIIYVVCVFTIMMVNFRNGHWILGILGFFFPIFWLIGVILPPTKEAVVEEVSDN